MASILIEFYYFFDENDSIIKFLSIFRKKKVKVFIEVFLNFIFY